MLTQTVSFKPKATEELLDYIFFRRVANYLVPYFIKTKMTPNQISFLSLGFGLLASVFLGKKYFFLSGTSVILAIIIDCCDGQVARLTGKTSPMGRILDGMVDFVWISCFWAVLYNGTGYFQSYGMEIFPLMLLSSISFILHVWRYDSVKIKSNELIYPDINQQDLDAHKAYDFMKESFHKRDFFNGTLAFFNVLHSFFFVRGSGKKQDCIMNDIKREKLKKILEPVVNIYSYLGVSHHNVLMVAATFMAPWTPNGYLISFWIMLVPLNLVMFYGEYRYFLAQKATRDILQRAD